MKPQTIKPQTAKPSISIVMPAYNAERHILDSLLSVQAQTWEEWELIVVDDGSQDRTAPIVQALAAQDPRIRYFFQANGGQARARNLGLSHAHSEWIAFLDADDLWMPEKLTRQLTAAAETGADLVFTSGYIFFDNDSADETHPSLSPVGRFSGRPLVTLLFQQNFVANLSVLVKKSALDRTGGFDPDRRLQNSEDYDLWLRLAQQGIDFYGIPDQLFHYRRHPHSATFREVSQFGPEISVLTKHAGCPGLPPAIQKRRFRSLYRALVAALLREGNISEARARLAELASQWDRGGLATGFQRIVLRLLPRQFNPIMGTLYGMSGQIKRWAAALREWQIDESAPKSEAPADPP